ncbi:RHS repeat-associated core domain-containing protein [Streptomyces sp. NBC_00448]|uniref:RHS repeat-associated core domain-containing protein n=1 Tax=Streptomyces sp. NBC_00448 TaxID=2903652 RepID=UPI002E2377CA
MRRAVASAADFPSATTDGAGKVTTLLPDILGSVVATGDSTGALTGTYTYDPFGTVTAPAGDTNPIRYTGLASGPGLPNGPQYNRDRFYSPAQERFVSQDPGGLAAGNADLYAYGSGDPVEGNRRETRIERPRDVRAYPFTFLKRRDEPNRASPLRHVTFVEGSDGRVPDG